MAKVYALLNFIAPDGTHVEPGGEIDLPRETDQEKADFDRLIREGVVSRSEAKSRPDSEKSETDEPAQRSRRSRS